jgi:protein-S-isoprenylcysteine O-methyltransferase Ste14
MGSIFRLTLMCFAMAIILTAVVLSPGNWNVERWIGLLIAVPAAALFLLAHYQLGRSFSVTPQARALVTHGVYSRIGNPIYVFSTLVLLAFVLILHKPRLLLILAILVPVQVFRAHREAKVLENKFGDTYREYRKKTWF